MFRNLFIEYLKMVLPKDENGNANSKTIKEYLYGVSGRIEDFAKKYHPDFTDITKLTFSDASHLILCLLQDKDFLEKCEKSNKVQITAINKYSNFIEYVNANQSDKIVDERGRVRNVAKEGEPYECHNVEYKRDRKLRNAVAKERDYTCEICGVKLTDIYGPIANEFIEVHHKEPIHEGERETTKEDLICVCPNCHSMLHRLDPVLSPEDLKLRIKIIKNR